MPLLSRPDGVWLSRLPAYQKMLPFVMPRRGDAAIVHRQTVRVGPALALLAELNAQPQSGHVTLFHLLLAAGVRLIALRPEVNRFVSGRRIYQRRAIELSFVAKQEKTVHGRETVLKLRFDARATLHEVAALTAAHVERARAGHATGEDRLIEAIMRLPRSLVRLVMAGVRTLDYWNLLPAAMIRSDPLYCSAFVANIGGLGADAVAHHLFEWGNCHFFAVIGRVKKDLRVHEDATTSVEDVVEVCFTLDERAVNGIALIEVIQLLTSLVEQPRQLLEPPAALPDPLEFA